MSSLIANDSFTINVNAKLDTKPVMYGSSTIPGTQDYALTGFFYEEAESSYIDNYPKNETKIVIKKVKEGTDVVLSNVKFNLLDNQKNIVKSNLLTDENGEIIVANILPGRYYLREIECKEGYELNDNELEIKINLFEEKELIISNREIPELEPEPEPIPELIPEPEPESEPESEPISEPEPEPEPIPEPISEPEPEPEPTLELKLELEPELILKPEQGLISNPVVTQYINVMQEPKLLPRTGF